MVPLRKLVQRMQVKRELMWVIIGMLVLFESSCEKKRPVEPRPAPVRYQIDHFPSVSSDGNMVAYAHSEPVSQDPSLEKFGIYLWDLRTDEKKLLIHSYGWGTGFSPDDKWLAFSDENVWKIKVSGDSLTRLSDDNDSFFPSWSPDGTKIAFDVSAGDNRGIYLMEPDGANKRLLVPKGRVPRWTRDGEGLIYTSWASDTHQPEIYHYGLATEQETRLTYLGNPRTFDAAVSPGGTKIAFTSGSRSELEQVWVLEIDGSADPKVKIPPKPITPPGYAEPAWLSEEQIVCVNIKQGAGTLEIIIVPKSERSR